MPGASNAFQNLLNRLGQEASLPQTPGNNPILNFAMGQPLQFRDNTGTASLMPNGTFNIQGNSPQSFRATIDPSSQALAVGKGIFDLKAGMQPSPYVEFNFDTRLNQQQPTTPTFLNEFLVPGTQQIKPTKSEAREYADQEIDKLRAGNPYYYAIDRFNKN